MLKHLYTCTICILLTFAAAGQNADGVLPERALVTVEDLVRGEARMQHYFARLESKRGTDDRAFLRRIFRHTQLTFLKKYVAYSEFQELFSSGNFDCLTATSLFSVALDRFHFRYSLIETNYHIFLIVHLTRGDVLIETTDRYNGFVTAPEKIIERTGNYRQNLVTAATGKAYHYSFDMYREISSAQLPGLLCFNQAIRAYNNKEWEKCADLMAMASYTYQSPRLEALAAILIKTVDLTESSSAVRSRVFSRLQPWIPKSVAGI